MFIQQDFQIGNVPLELEKTLTKEQHLSPIIISEIDEEIKIFEHSIVNVRQGIPEKQSRLEIYQKAIKNIDDYKVNQLNEANKFLKKLEDTKDTLKDQIEKIENIYANVHSVLEKSKNQYRTLSSKIGFVGTSFIVASLKTYISSLKKKIVSLNIEIETTKRDIDVKQKLGNQELKIDLKNKIAILKRLIKNDESIIENNEEQMKELQETKKWLHNNKDFSLK